MVVDRVGQPGGVGGGGEAEGERRGGHPLPRRREADAELVDAGGEAERLALVGRRAVERRDERAAFLAEDGLAVEPRAEVRGRAHDEERVLRGGKVEVRLEQQERLRREAGEVDRRDVAGEEDLLGERLLLRARAEAVVGEPRAVEAAPAEAPKESVQPEAAAAAAPEAKPVPRRRAVKTGASLSLNSLMGEHEDGPKGEAAAEGSVSAELTDEEIVGKWKEMAGLYPNQPRLANTLSNAKVEVSREDGLTVTFVVTNDAQRAWIESNKLHELEGKFQKLLGRPGVKLLVTAAQYVEEKVIYTPEDKAKYLMENVPEVIDIISDLGLDIK